MRPLNRFIASTSSVAHGTYGALVFRAASCNLLCAFVFRGDFDRPLYMPICAHECLDGDDKPFDRAFGSLFSVPDTLTHFWSASICFAILSYFWTVAVIFWLDLVCAHGSLAGCNKLSSCFCSVLLLLVCSYVPCDKHCSILYS